MKDESIYIARRKKLFGILVFIFIIVAIIAVIYTVSTAIYRAGKAKVEIYYAPFAAKVTIGDMQVRNNATNYIVPGDYKMTVEFENFNTKEFDVEIREGMEPLFGMLTAANEEGEKYISEHIADFQKVESLFGKDASKRGEEIRQTWPIINKLPIREPHYSIGYSMPTSNEFYITIKSTVAWRAMAVDKLMSVLTEDDIMRYDVDIRDLDTPFVAEFKENNGTNLEEYFRNGYGVAMNGFSVKDSKCEQGYCYGRLDRNVKYAVDTYRFVVKKDGNKFQFVGTPYPVLTGVNTPGVPKDILYKVDKNSY